MAGRPRGQSALWFKDGEGCTLALLQGTSGGVRAQGHYYGRGLVSVAVSHSSGQTSCALCKLLHAAQASPRNSWT